MRRKHLARAALALLEGRALCWEGYPVVKKVLWERQHRKCAWCGRPMSHASQPVEHYRPKGCADRSDASATPPQKGPVDAGYWWLAWTWDNLLFGCATCNGHKLDLFPLLSARRATVPRSGVVLGDDDPAFDVSAEEPALLDPARDDPTRHITWRPENPSEAHDQLRWRPYGRTARGRSTIEALHFKGWLADHVTEHLRRLWAAHVKAIVRQFSQGRMAEARRAWAEMIGAHFAPRATLHAATWDGLCYFVTRERLEGYHLPLPRPGAAPAQGPREAPLAEPAALRALPDALRLLVHAEEAATPELMLRLYDHAAWTDETMAEALSLTTATVQRHRRALAASVTATAGGFRRAGL
ncbi:MAG: hypothetical protein U0324_23465 [Polyangiales bacterium]